MARAALSKSDTPAVERGENRVVTAQQIGDGENTGKDVDTAAEPVFAKRILAAFLRGRSDLSR